MSRHNWGEKLMLLGGSAILLTKLYQTIKKYRPFQTLVIHKEVKSSRPTLLIHGTNGTRRSLGGMIDRWQKAGLAYKAFDIEVAKDGQLTLTGEWQATTQPKHPLIQVVFKERDPSEWQQGHWLQQVLTLLQEKLGVTDINFLGHSVGAVGALRYIVDRGQSSHLPKVRKLVSIGAPFNGEVVDRSGQTAYDLGESGPLKANDTYRYFTTFSENLLKELEVLMIYGDLENGSRSDGFVSIDSARSLGIVLKKKIAFYTEKKITGIGAQHSLLHENKEVDRLAAAFLWSL